MKLRTVFITIGFALAGGSISAPLMADQFVNLDVPLSMVIPSNACTTQAIALNGPVHMSFSLTINNNSIHMHTHTNSQDVSGVGLVDGLRYNLVMGSNGDANFINFTGAPPLEMQTNSDYDLIGQGSAPNMRMRLVTHTTVNANGTVAVEFVKGSIVCQ